MKYYKEHAEEYIAQTQGADMSALYDWFLAYVPLQAHRLLDLGFGSARDSLFFKNRFEVVLVDPEPQFVEHARSLGFAEVYESDALHYELLAPVDVVWASASLLHLNTNELKKALKHIRSSLTEDGVVYCSFKYGGKEEMRDDRFYNDMNETKLKRLLKGLGLELVAVKITGDSLHRKESWFNAVLRRNEPKTLRD